MRPVRAFRFLIPSKLEAKWGVVDQEAGSLADARHIERPFVLFFSVYHETCQDVTKLCNLFIYIFNKY